MEEKKVGVEVHYEEEEIGWAWCWWCRGLQIVVLLKVGAWRHAGSDVIVSSCWISDWSKALN